VVVALIIIGVLLFLAFDAWLIWRVFLGGNRDGRYGSVAVPGETSLTLPAGKVKLTYQESCHAGGGGESTPIQFYVPDTLRLTLVAAGGGGAAPLELKLSGGHSAQTIPSFIPGGPRSRVKIGTVEIASAGSYVLRAEGAPADSAAPTVLAG
jgi:hypothetical protein